MKADWDDAPQYLKKPTRSQEIMRWLIAVALGVGFTGLTIYVAGNHLGLFQPKSPTTQNSPTDSYTPAYQFDEPASQPQQTAEQQFWNDINERNRQKAQPKQTDYNESNYIPKGAANVVSMEGVRQSEAYRHPTQRAAPSTSTSIEHTGEWVDKWSGGAHYYAAWTVINNHIDDTSVCANHKRGSIDFRECRKGAKQFFKEQCRSWNNRWQSYRQSRSDRMKQRYCSAASNFNPMAWLQTDDKESSVHS